MLANGQRYCRRNGAPCLKIKAAAPEVTYRGFTNSGPAAANASYAIGGC
jgi:hypothetical protein